MSFFKVFEVAGSALTAQQVRLNVTASNMANAEAVAGSPETTYRARHPVFATVLDNAFDNSGSAGVRVQGIVEGTTPALSRYAPEHPLADERGYVFMPNINLIEEMANMIAASRAYQNNVEVMNTTKQLMLNTINLGR